MEGMGQSSDILPQLTPDQQAEILHLSETKNWPARFIAHRCHTTVPIVVGFLRKYKSTVQLAQAHFRSRAFELAERVCDQANVDQSLEVLDRVDALNRKRDTSTAPSFNIVVGVGVGTSAAPIPSDADITAELVPVPETEPSLLCP